MVLLREVGRRYQEGVETLQVSFKGDERILQVASLEQGSLELVRAPLDGHELVAAVAESFGLRVESLGPQHGAELRSEPRAHRSSPAASSTLLSRKPLMRILGPCRSPSTATSLPIRAATRRIIPTRLRWSSSLP